MPKYKNISGQDLEIPGIGVIKADEVIEQPDGFNNANFVKVEEETKEKIKRKEESKEK